jgi:NDP-sugar pyrophosphorylase family protein
MRAVILAGGSGARLWPLTRDRPPAMLPVVNRPVVEHLLESLVSHGVESATLILHHCPYPVETRLVDGTRLGLRLGYVLERVPLGSAGSARRVAAWWEEPFVLAAGTALTTVDLSKAAAFHQAHQAALTLLVVPSTRHDGAVDLSPSGRVRLPASAGRGSFTLTGLAIVSPSALRVLPDRSGAADLIADLLPRLLHAGQPVYGHVNPGPSLVIRTIGDLLDANRRALAGELPHLVVPGVEVEPGIRVCRGARVHSRARLSPPVLVGVNAVVDRDAVLAATVVGDDVIVDPASTIHGSVVLSRTHVGSRLRLDDVVVSPEGVGRARPTTWINVSDDRLLADTRAPGPVASSYVAGRLGAAVALGLTAPAWLPTLLALVVESRGRPFRARRIVGARGRAASLRVVAVRGPCGRVLRRLGWQRLPLIWSILRGDLRWVGTTPRTRAELDALRARGEPDLAPPGLVTLAQFTPARLRRGERLALDRLYATTRSRGLDLRLLAAAVRPSSGMRLHIAPPASLP